MRKIFSLLVLLLLLEQRLPAQSIVPVYFVFNPALYNPAAVGSSDKTQITAGISIMLPVSDYHDAPYISTHLLFEKPLEKLHSNLGVHCNYDNYNELKTNIYKTGLDYNYRIALAPDVWLSPGVSLDFQHKNLEFGLVHTADPGDPVLIAPFATNYFNIGAGLAFRYKGLTAGVNFNDLLARTEHYKNRYMTLDESTRQFRYFNVAYVFKLNPVWQFRPAILYRTGSVGQVDNLTLLNGTFSWIQKWDIGLSYQRSGWFGNKIILNAGWKFLEHYDASLIVFYPAVYVAVQGALRYSF